MTDNINFSSWLMDYDNKKIAIDFLKKSEAPLEDLSYLDYKTYCALKREQLDYIYQALSLSEELCKYDGIGAEMAENVVSQIYAYLEERKQDIFELKERQMNRDSVMEPDVDPGLDKNAFVEKNIDLNNNNSEDAPELFYVQNKDRVLAFVKANDIPVEKIFSNRLVNYLSPNYKYLSDLLFVDKNTLEYNNRLSPYYSEKVVSKVKDYLDINHLLIVAYCNGDDGAINSVLNHYTDSEEKPEKKPIISLSRQNVDDIEYYDIDGHMLSVIDLANNDIYKNKIVEYAKANDITFEQMGLSNRSKNCLRRNGYLSLSAIIFETEESLSEIRNMGKNSIDEVIASIKAFLINNQKRIISYCKGEKSGFEEGTQQDQIDPAKLGIFEMINMPKYKDELLRFVMANNRQIKEMNLSARAQNCMEGAGYDKLSDFIFKDEEELRGIKNLGSNSLAEIIYVKNDYLRKNEDQIIAFCKGDTSFLFSIEVLQNKVIRVYKDKGFTGLHYGDILEEINFPNDMDDSNVKAAIGKLIVEKQLEYVDYRCYKTYIGFEEYLEKKANVSEKEKKCLLMRLKGETLESIASMENVTRERIRQIVKKGHRKVISQYLSETGLDYFDEDYYQYFFTKYNTDRELCLEWLGIPESTYNYLNTFYNRGDEDVESAIDDPNIDVGIKLKISNYINRNKIYIDGNWIEKKKACIEEVVLAKYCRDEVSFNDYCKIYNGFLEELGLGNDDSLLYTTEVIPSRYNRLSETRYVLWKQFQMLRYYDIDGQDYTELLETLGLETYENTQVSTLKLFNDNKDLMSQYDIRDHWELHNLLRKIVPEGRYHDFKCQRMPIISFGEFDRNAAILDIIINNAPISVNDLTEKLYQEYGYEKATIQSTILQPFSAYYHKGFYKIDQKVMALDHMNELKQSLTNDFYYIDEVKRIYHNMHPEADLDEINPYTLKLMGFLVLSRYVLQHYNSLEAYFVDMLTKEELTDISSLKKKYCTIVAWYQTLTDLKKKYEVIEYEPDQLMRISKLEKAGITKKMLKDYCDSVYDYIDDESYFSAKSLRNSGFESELYDLGFSDWFYAGILCSDGRFMFNNMMGTIILFKGKKAVSINSFIGDYVKRVESIDVYELQNVLEDEYGCNNIDRYRLCRNPELFYDTYLQRLYCNEEAYYRELDDEKETSSI